jgi:hypothetical protein
VLIVENRFSVDPNTPYFPQGFLLILSMRVLWEYVPGPGLAGLMLLFTDSS